MRDREPEELIVAWTLVEDDWRLLSSKAGATRLGFALMLKYFELEGEFPRYGEQLPPPTVEFVAELVKVEATEFAKYAFDNRTAKRHRTQIREALGFRPATEDDGARWVEWLATEQCPVEQNRDRLEVALRQRCRSESAEPPSEGQIDRVIGSALRQHETAFAALIVDRLGPAPCAAMQALLESEGRLAEVKADPGPLGLDTLLGEIAKLRTVRGLGLCVGWGYRPRCSPGCQIGSSRRGGRGRHECSPRTSPSAPSRCGTRCSRRCAGCARPRSPTRWSGCWWT